MGFTQRKWDIGQYMPTERRIHQNVLGRFPYITWPKKVDDVSHVFIAMFVGSIPFGLVTALYCLC